MASLSAPDPTCSTEPCSWPRLSGSLGALLVAGGAVLLVGCAGSPDVPPPSSENPLPDCPDSPNCERTSRAYDVPPESLYRAARQALDALGPASLRLMADSLRASAVYRVALVFKDDVDVAVTPDGDGSVLHVRSASRVGYDDLGVNRRRVGRLLHAVDEALP